MPSRPKACPGKSVVYPYRGGLDPFSPGFETRSHNTLHLCIIMCYALYQHPAKIAPIQESFHFSDGSQQMNTAPGELAATVRPLTVVMRTVEQAAQGIG